MSDAPVSGWRAAVAALLGSYAADLRRWMTGLVAGYAIAAALLAGAILALFAAIAVGITALFHFIERHYGMNAAYGGIGGGLFILAIVLVLCGWMMLRRKVPRLPRPYRQVRAAKQRLLGAPASRPLGGRLQAQIGQADPVTGLLIAASVTMLVGWMVASRRQYSKRARQVRP